MYSVHLRRYVTLFQKCWVRFLNVSGHFKICLNSLLFSWCSQQWLVPIILYHFRRRTIVSRNHCHHYHLRNLISHWVLLSEEKILILVTPTLLGYSTLPRLVGYLFRDPVVIHAVVMIWLTWLIFFYFCYYTCIERGSAVVKGYKKRIIMKLRKEIL